MFSFRIDETKTFAPLSIAVLVVSDTRTLDTDASGKVLVEMLTADGHRCAERAIVPDDKGAIRAKVAGWIADPQIDVVLTTGGTGFAKRDVTPEAVQPLFDKVMEGFSILFHQYSAQKIGTSSIQSRATAGLSGETLVFCLPGSKGACRDAWEGILRYQLDSRHAPCNFVEILPRFAGRT